MSRCFTRGMRNREEWHDSDQDLGIGALPSARGGRGAVQKGQLQDRECGVGAGEFNGSFYVPPAPPTAAGRGRAPDGPAVGGYTSTPKIARMR